MYQYIVDYISPAGTLSGNCTHFIIATVWDKDNKTMWDKEIRMMRWMLIGIVGVIAAILFIAVITCIIFSAMVAKGTRFLIQYFSTSSRTTGECDIERNQNQQLQQPQNEGTTVLLILPCPLASVQNTQPNTTV